MSSIVNMGYNVYLSEFLRFGKNHYTLFVEMYSNNSGQMFEVEGSIQQGLTYKSSGPLIPKDDPTFLANHPLGTVSYAKYNEIDPICRRIEPPAKQFEGGKRINPKVPLRNIPEWLREVIKAMRDQGVLENY
ncbi:hypothetical protein RBB50_011284 [Rhinocladiella similis]